MKAAACARYVARNMAELRYLTGYPPHLIEQVAALRDQGRLGDWLQQRYPDGAHDIQSDRALYDYAQALKQRGLKNTPPLAKVLYDSQQHPVRGTLGTHTRAARVQGGKLKTRHEIRIGALFRYAPEPMLRMIVAHELAHLKESEHNKAFYQLCEHLAPGYAQLEFDARVWLVWRED